MSHRTREETEFSIDLSHISLDEVHAWLDGLNLRERQNHRRTQAWFDHCARIRENPASKITPLEGPSNP